MSQLKPRGTRAHETCKGEGASRARHCLCVLSSMGMPRAGSILVTTLPARAGPSWGSVPEKVRNGGTNAPSITKLCGFPVLVHAQIVNRAMLMLGEFHFHRDNLWQSPAVTMINDDK